MKKLLVFLVLIGLVVFGFSSFRDVPTNHWALKSIEKLMSIGVFTGFPDNTFRGDESLTRYQAAQLIDRTLEYIENNLILDLKETVVILKETVEKHSQDINDISIALEVLEKDILSLYETSENLKKMIEDNNAKLEEVVAELNELLDTLANRIEILEEHANMIYDSLQKKVDNEVFEGKVSDLEQQIADLETDVLNIKSTLEDGLPALRTAVYQLYEDLASLESKLTEYINVVTEDIYNKIDELVGLYDELGTFETRLSLLEEYANAMYETLQTKVDNDIFEEKISLLDESVEGLDARISLAEEYLNMLYESQGLLSEKIDEISQKVDNAEENMVNLIDERATTLQQNIELVSVDILNIISKNQEQDEKLGELAVRLESLDLRVSLVEESASMIYDSLLETNEKVAQLENQIDQKNQEFEDQLAQKNQEIESLKQANQIATILGASGVIVGIIAILKAFGVF